MTKDGIERLQKELEQLRDVRRHEVADRIHQAKELASAQNNAEYEEAKNEQAFVEGRILQLEHLLQNATVIDEEAAHHATRAQLGSKVSCRIQRRAQDGVHHRRRRRSPPHRGHDQQRIARRPRPSRQTRRRSGSGQRTPRRPPPHRNQHQLRQGSRLRITRSLPACWESCISQRKTATSAGRASAHGPLDQLVLQTNPPGHTRPADLRAAAAIFRALQDEDRSSSG